MSINKTLHYINPNQASFITQICPFHGNILNSFYLFSWGKKQLKLSFSWPWLGGIHATLGTSALCQHAETRRDTQRLTHVRHIHWTTSTYELGHNISCVLTPGWHVVSVCELTISVFYKTTSMLNPSACCFSSNLLSSVSIQGLCVWVCKGLCKHEQTFNTLDTGSVLKTSS